MRSIYAALPALLCAMLIATIASGQEAHERMSVNEAIELIPQSTVMNRERELRDRVIAAFAGLPEEDARDAAEKLREPLKRVTHVQSRIPLSGAYMNLGEIGVEALIEAARNDPPALDNILYILPRMRRPAVAGITDLLTHPDPNTRYRGAVLLETMIPSEARQADVIEAAVHALAGQLADESPLSATQAAKALAVAGAAAKPALPALIEALASPEADLRAASALAIGVIGADAADAVEPLIVLLNDAEDLPRIQAANSLAEIGEPAFDALRAALSADESRVRRASAFALGLMKPDIEGVSEALLQALRDPDETVRATAMNSLARVAGRDALASIAGGLNDESPLVRSEAARILDILAADAPELRAAAGLTLRKIAAQAREEVRPLPSPSYLVPANPDTKYEIGGPLEGRALSKYATHHGEPVGFPGSIPELVEAGEVMQDMGNIYRDWGPQGQAPEWQLYPGSVEHYRAYWGKYVPVRPMFDAASQILNFRAIDVAGVPEGRMSQYAEPVYWVPRHAQPRFTGFKNPPVPVVQCSVNDPVFDLDFGTLPVGIYAVRLIGAVETEHLERVRLPLYVTMSVNDGPDGTESRYRMRCGYQDDFYAVAEIFFHAPETREYSARIWVDEGSMVELLVYNISLDDALAGIDRRPVKSRMTLNRPEDRDALRLEEQRKRLEDNRPHVRDWTPPLPRSLEEQWARDAMLWNMWPGVNAQPGFTYGAPPDVLYGIGGEPSTNPSGDQDAAADEWGRWTPPWPRQAFNTFPWSDAPLRLLADGRQLLTNSAMAGSYTLDDYKAGRSLPDPYPYKDDGAGLYFPAADGNGAPQLFNAVAHGINNRINAYRDQVVVLSRDYHETANPQSGRDAAVMLIRMALDAPSIDASQSISSVVADPGPWGRDLRFRRRETVASWHASPDLYDRLFDVIDGNEELARSVNRFIPWIENGGDLIAMLDAYLVQSQARRIMRYHTLSDNVPTYIVTPTVILGDGEFTAPWMEWLWAKAYIYPNPTSGLPDLITTANDRNGAGYIGSWMYCHGEEASRPGDILGEYIASGGDTKYDLRDPREYPKVTAATYWPLRTSMAGLYWPRVGDVGGPDKGYAFQFVAFPDKMRRGWAWTKDPVFAWMILNYSGRTDQNDADWEAITRAAATIERAPFMTQPSRAVINWFGVLEAGQRHDDPRFRRAVMLRIGQGAGHAHYDTLDLQIYAHGYPFTIDDGQRSGYTAGSSASTRWHNVVQVDDLNWMEHAWIRSMSDGEGARYMLAEAIPPGDATSFRRQVMLIDVDEGEGAGPVTPAGIARGTDLPRDVITPNSYIVDIVRVAGGRKHTYNFHGPIDDELVANVDNYAPSDRGVREGMPHSERGFTGTAPERLIATWRMAREVPSSTALGERNMAPWFDPESPFKYTRLHLLGLPGAEVYTDYTFCRQWSYGFNNLYTMIEADEPIETLFPAVIEPYVGEPFIRDIRLLPIEDNDAGASRAVAMEVTTVNGHTDRIFADGSEGGIRRAGDDSWSGEFGFVSRDDEGLRLAALTGGTLLATPEFTIRVAAAELRAAIIDVDYTGRIFRTDPSLPPLKRSERALEIVSGLNPTTYMASRIEGDAVHLSEGADRFASRILEIDEEARIVYCALPLPHTARDREVGLVASNRDRSKFWRAEYLGRQEGDNRFGFRLDGPVSEEEFGASQSFRIWEYGVGDSVRQPSSVTLRRVGPGVYELAGNQEVELTIGGRTLRFTADELAENDARIEIR